MNNKKLMVLGTNEALLNRAVEMGYEVHAFGLNPPDEKKTSKEKVIFHKQDILDYDSLWDACQRLKPQGVVSVCSELAMHPMHYLLRKLRIPCNTEWTEKITTDKYLMRKVMKDAGLDSPKFTLVTEQSTFEDIKKSIKGFHYPLIIKPVDLSASRGVMKINTSTDLCAAIEYSLGWSVKKECILEEFIEGPEYSGESIAYQGKYKLLAITEKLTTGAPYFVEVAHRQPASVPEDLAKTIEQILYKAFESLKIEYGAIHPEFRVANDGRIFFMEIATRMGGDCIGTDLTPLSSGYDFLGMVINICCGKAPDFNKISSPMPAEVHYILNDYDYNEFQHIVKNSPELIWRQDIASHPANNTVRKSGDRSGYYITIKPIK